MATPKTTNIITTPKKVSQRASNDAREGKPLQTLITVRNLNIFASSMYRLCAYYSLAYPACRLLLLIVELD